MGSVNISLKKEAYNFLRSLKTKDKSFSDIILEFKENEDQRGSAKSIMRFFGALKDADIDWEEKEKVMKKLREDFDKRIKETAEYMGKSRK
ncbi:MAG: antitoxin VapB family protein [Nanoarchaeota archaeon]|nr:antitoxin VapB family protein [Nanoarchaeota archaeon]